MSPKAPKTIQASNQISLVQDKAHENALVITIKGKKVVITEADITRVLKFKQPKVSTQNDSMQLLGFKGLQTAADVITFLKSISGEKTKALLNEQLAVLIALLKLQTQHLLRNELLRTLFIVNLRLLKVAERAEDSKALNAAYQKQIDKSLAYAKTVAEQGSKASNSPDYTDEALRKMIQASFTLTGKIIDKDLQEKLAEAKRLEKEVADHQIKGEKIKGRYNILEDHLQLMDDHFEVLQTMQSEEEKLAATEAVQSVIQDGMKEVSIKIQQYVSKGENNQADMLIQHLDGLNTQAESLKQMLDVINLQKLFYDAEGLLTHSYRHASYSIPRQLELVRDKDTGKFYLIQAGKALADLPLEEKVQAQQKYEDTKPQIVTIKHIINQNKILELNSYEEKTKALVERTQAIKNSILDLTHRKNQHMAAEAKVLSLIKNSKGDDLKKFAMPKPAPKPKATKQVVAKHGFFPVPSYSKALLKLNPYNPTQESIDQLMNGLVKSDGKPNLEAQKAVSNAIKANQIILPTTMNKLAADLERLEKTSISSIFNPLKTKPSPSNT